MKINPEALANRIAMLDVGASLSVTQRVPLWVNKNPARASAEISEARRVLKNRLAPHIARAKVRAGGTFTLDTAVALSFGYTHLLITASVTRLTDRRSAR